MSRLQSLLNTNRSAAITIAVVLSVVASAIGVRTVTADGSPPAAAAEGNGSDVAVVGGGDGSTTARGAAAKQRRGAAADQRARKARNAGQDGSAQAAAAVAGRSKPATSGGGAGTAAGGTGAGKTVTPGGRRPGASADSGTPLPGVSGNEITVAYYWKGDRTRTSPYLRGSGAEANVDEAEAFRKLVDYINANADGGGRIMGYPFNLHGRRLKAVVVDAGQDPESYAAAAEQLTQEIRPLAAIAAHGSISTYLCPALAKAGIHNFATYDLAGALSQRTNGYCTPGSISWERQVALTQAYLLRLQRTEPDRVFGVVYTEYPGLVESAPRVIERFKAAGINIAETATLNASLSTAQQQAPNVVARMRGAGVNTIVMPDAGAPLNFTHAAQAQGYSPDYYVWPCSGQDTAAMARLFNAPQWNGAAGLTCYDEQFSSDLTHNAQTRATEWYAAYQEAAPGQEPPAPTPFVYAALLPLVVGLTEAGPALTLERFREGINSFSPYRYNAVEGRTRNAASMLLSVGARDRSFMADVAKLRFDGGQRTDGSTTPGAYVFPEPRRYASPAAL